MNENRWINKHKIICKECSNETDGRYKHNGDTLCVGCFSKRPSKFSLSFNTHKDLAYNFTTEMFDGKPIQIHSHKQYKNLLKKYHLVDASIKEAHQEAVFRKRINQEDYKRERRKTAENIFSGKRELLRFRGIKR